MIDIRDWIETHAVAMRQVDVWKDAVSVTLPASHETGFVIDVDGKRVIAQFIVWANGAMEATAGSVADGRVFYVDAMPYHDEVSLNAHWCRFCSAILREEVDDG